MLLTRVKGKLLAFLAAALVAACFVPAAAMASYTSGPDALFGGPSPYSPTGEATLPGWSITMRCWTDSAYWMAGTNRWFLVYGTGWAGSNIGFVTGWISANLVNAQTRVGHC